MRKKITPALVVFGAVLVLGGFLLSGCRSKPKPTPSEAAITQLGETGWKAREIVKDPERAAKLQARFDDLEELIRENAKSLAAHNEQIRSLLLDYNATNEQFEEAYAAFDKERESRIGQAIQIAEDVRFLTTPEEWDELYKSRKKTLNEILGSTQSS